MPRNDCSARSIRRTIQPFGISELEHFSVQTTAEMGVLFPDASLVHFRFVFRFVFYFVFCSHGPRAFGYLPPVLEERREERDKVATT
jgi:hypothetical protein